jgi:hypothetical protein
MKELNKRRVLGRHRRRRPAACRGCPDWSYCRVHIEVIVGGNMTTKRPPVAEEPEKA